MRRRLYLSILLVIMVIGISIPGMAFANGPGSLTTMYNFDNTQDGNMFDVITADEVVTIDGFDVNFGYFPEGGSTIVEVYYKSGSYSGFEKDPEAWTLLGSANVTPNPPDTPTPLPVGGLVMQANSTYGIYITGTTTQRPDFHLGYTDKIVEGELTLSEAEVTWTLSDDYLTITEGTGNVYPFGYYFNSRIWNGTIYYSTEAVPGADEGNKNGWDGSAPPGLDNTDKNPPGFSVGNKSGWAKNK